MKVLLMDEHEREVLYELDQPYKPPAPFYYHGDEYKASHQRADKTWIFRKTVNLHASQI